MPRDYYKFRRGILENNYAKFYKCALQVNPFNYIQYRGSEHLISEQEYNEVIYQNCFEAGISVIGLADHGNVQNSKSLRQYLSERNLTVFPGFEIATSEKIHIVCLFDEKTPEEKLERYLGSLELTDTEDGVSPSILSFTQIAKKIEELGGFWYAAHITQDNGVLKQQQQHIWQSDYLAAAQIPAKRGETEDRYKNILRNKDPNYQKNIPFALINAKDISKPDDLLLETASSLVKMSEPNFNSFKLAFRDPNARVKLNSDLNDETPQSSIKNVKVFGGYLDEFELNLSPNLNTIIGGRGTGKSTLIELIRYALEKYPMGHNANRTYENVLEGNLGAGGRVEADVVSHKQFGRQYKIIKRFNEPTVIMNLDETKSKLNIEDILPDVEVYSQNEIVEITDSEDSKLQILNRFLGNREEINNEIEINKSAVRKNTKTLIEKYERYDEITSQINKLPNLREKQKHFDELGISQKLEVQGLITKEENHLSSAKDNINKHVFNLNNVNIPFTEEFVNNAKNSCIFTEVKCELENFNKRLNQFRKEYESFESSTKQNLESISQKWYTEKQKVETEIKKAIQSLDETGGKNGQEIAEEYTTTLKDIANIEPLEQEVKDIRLDIKELEEGRSNLIEQLNLIYDSDLDNLRKTVKRINKKKLQGKVNIEIRPKRNREPLLHFLSQEKGLGLQGLKWINEIEGFNITDFITNIRSGKDTLYEAYKSYGLQQSKADILAVMSRERIYELEIIDIPNIIDIQLNVGSQQSEHFKSLNKLSKGQQCTAILNILMLDNDDPLIVDQPEDNLDNAYIANNLVEGIRNLKINRQYIFATHNANIPVFGDSELIGVMEEKDNQGTINSDCIGSVDNVKVKEAVVNILEGISIA